MKGEIKQKHLDTFSPFLVEIVITITFSLQSFFYYTDNCLQLYNYYDYINVHDQLFKKTNTASESSNNEEMKTKCKTISPMQYNVSNLKKRTLTINTITRLTYTQHITFIIRLDEQHQTVNCYFAFTCL